MISPRNRVALAATSLLVILAACGDSSTTTTAQATTTLVQSAATAAPTTSVTTTTIGTTTAPPSGSTTTTTLTPVTVTTMTTTAPPQPTVAIDITVTNGEVKGPGRVKVAMGDFIVLTVTADVADEVHFHGYDLFGDVAPGQPAIIKVEALIPGVFEVELEGSRLELVLIEVK